MSLEVVHLQRVKEKERGQDLSSLGVE